MANNCCATEIIKGGVLASPNIQAPTVNGGEFTGVTLKGGVTLADDMTKHLLVDQLCEKLEPCIKRWVSNNSFDNITLGKPTLTQGVIEDVTLQGTVKLADSVRDAMAEQLCASLRHCVEGYVNGGEFSEVRLTRALVDGLTLNGDLIIAASALNQLVADLRPLLKDVVAEHVNGHTFNKVTLQAPTLAAATLSGGVSFDTTTAQSIISGVREPFNQAVKDEFDKYLKDVPPGGIGALPADKPNINQAQITASTISGNSVVTGSKIDHNAGTGNTFAATALNGGTSISGEVLLDSAASESLCRQLDACISKVIDDAFDANTIAGVFQDCSGVPHAPGTRLPTCDDLSEKITAAIKSLPALDVIKGVSYDAARHTLTITSQLAGGTEQRWDVNLDSLGGQVVPDGVTIGGSGTTGSPLRVIMKPFAGAPKTSAGKALPTELFGSRGQLLGAPDTWIDFGGYLIPAFSKPGVGGSARTQPQAPTVGVSGEPVHRTQPQAPAVDVSGEPVHRTQPQAPAVDVSGEPVHRTQPQAPAVDVSGEPVHRTHPQAPSVDVSGEPMHRASAAKPDEHDADDGDFLI